MIRSHAQTKEKKTYVEECAGSSAKLSLSDDQKPGSNQRDEDIEEYNGSSAAPVLCTLNVLTEK
jgi:hypothetical protein